MTIVILITRSAAEYLASKYGQTISGTQAWVNSNYLYITEKGLLANSFAYCPRPDDLVIFQIIPDHKHVFKCECGEVKQ